ncbi:hypothetical protein ACOMHN_014139 [Nucella lapillus]
MDPSILWILLELNCVCVHLDYQLIEMSAKMENHSSLYCRIIHVLNILLTEQSVRNAFRIRIVPYRVLPDRPTRMPTTGTNSEKSGR